MYVPFENLPPESKVWIYQSNRKFTEEEWSAIETDLKALSIHGRHMELV